MDSFAWKVAVESRDRLPASRDGCNQYFQSNIINRAGVKYVTILPAAICNYFFFRQTNMFLLWTEATENGNSLLQAIISIAEHDVRAVLVNDKPHLQID